MDKYAMLKSLIEMASSFEDADGIISEFTPWENDSQKLAFLSGMFNVNIVGSCNGDETDDEKMRTDYEAVLSAIVNNKWRTI